MDDADARPGPPDLDAGAFAAWLTSTRAAVAGRRDAEVPCDGCTACCASSQFVLVGPDETEALAHIPAELLVAAPGAPAGHVVLGYDEHGRCPMLGDAGCTIYEHRPRTCRTYDCRVFAAADVDPGVDPTKQAIAERARRWRFSHPTPADQAAHGAVRRAARQLVDDAADLPADVAPHTETERAVAALVVHDLFLDGTPSTTAVAVTLRSRSAPR
jgi:Fe-S-cluster containining protein